KARYIFLCAGAIQTPNILLKSGYRHNIGNNLQFHPTIKAVAEFDGEVNECPTSIPVHQVKEFSPTLSLGGSISNLQYLSMALQDHEHILRNLHINWRRFSSYYAMIIPESKGKIKTIPLSNDPIVLYD